MATPAAFDIVRPDSDDAPGCALALGVSRPVLRDHFRIGDDLRRKNLISAYQPRGTQP